MSILFLCIFSSTIETEAFFPFPSSFAVVSSNTRAPSPLFPTPDPTRTTLFRCRLIYHLGWWFCLMLRLSFSPRLLLLLFNIRHRVTTTTFFYSLYHFLLTMTFLARWCNSRNNTKSVEASLTSLGTSQTCRCSGNFCRLLETAIERAASRTISRNWNGSKKFRKLIFLHVSHGWVDWKGWLDLAILLQTIHFCAEWNPNGV